MVQAAYLDSSGKQMSVMGQTSGEGRSIVKRELRPSLREFQASLERVDFFPELDYFFLFPREVELGSD
jgi:hypothetical protein